MLLEQIGEGGGGVVYMAEQEEPDRIELRNQAEGFGWVSGAGRRLEAPASEAPGHLKSPCLSTDILTHLLRISYHSLHEGAPSVRH
jgi:hypothetical protein